VQPLGDQCATQLHRPIVRTIARTRRNEAGLHTRGNRIHADHPRNFLEKVDLAGEVRTT
jgi:hypothetical protein